MPSQPFGPFFIPSKFIFHQTSLSCAFVNLRPLIPGHVLVIPKRPTPRLAGLTDEETSDLFKCVRETQRMVEGFHSSNCANVAIQDGKGAGQTVPHVHVHILPRFEGDGWENDRIYAELEEWIPKDGIEAKEGGGKFCMKDERNDRTEGEMESEAAGYRGFGK